MGMWIRSQDSEILAECSAFLVSPSHDLECCIYAYCDNDRVYLGHYSTKEKALKVLDMIEKKIIKNNTIVCNENDWAKYVGAINCVFQMPQDNEVLENE